MNSSRTGAYSCEHVIAQSGSDPCFCRDRAHKYWIWDARTNKLGLRYRCQTHIGDLGEPYIPEPYEVVDPVTNEDVAYYRGNYIYRYKCEHTLAGGSCCNKPAVLAYHNGNCFRCYLHEFEIPPDATYEPNCLRPVRIIEEE